MGATRKTHLVVRQGNEIDRILCFPCRRTKNNVMFVGAPDVEGLSHHMTITATVLYEFDVACVYRHRRPGGQDHVLRHVRRTREGAVKEVDDSNDNVILYIHGHGRRGPWIKVITVRIYCRIVMKVVFSMATPDECAWFCNL